MPMAIPMIVGAVAASAVPAGFTIGFLSAAASASLIGGTAGYSATPCCYDSGENHLDR